MWYPAFLTALFETIVPHWQEYIALGHRLPQLMKQHWQALIITSLKSYFFVQLIIIISNVKMGGTNECQVNIFCLGFVYLNWIAKICSVCIYFSFLVSSSSFCLSYMNAVRQFWIVCLYLYMQLLVYSWKYGVRRLFFFWISILVFFFWKLLDNSNVHGMLQKNQFVSAFWTVTFM